MWNSMSLITDSRKESFNEKSFGLFITQYPGTQGGITLAPRMSNRPWRSVMACGAIRLRLNFPLAFQEISQLKRGLDAFPFFIPDGMRAEVVCGGITGTGRFLQRAQMGSRIAVAVQTPLHAGVAWSPDAFHARHVSMAGRAADAPVQVGHVVKIGVTGQAVDHHPADRFSCVTGVLRVRRFPQGGDERAVRKNMLVAAQTGLRIRNAGSG